MSNELPGDPSLPPGCLPMDLEDKRRPWLEEEPDMKTPITSIAKRLEYLRGEIQAERISYGEIAELQSLAAHIAPGDTLLREWAGLPEHGAR